MKASSGGILRYFDGVQIGLTATPFSSEPDTGDEENKLFVRDTVRFFEMNRPTFHCTMEQAVHEAYLVPYQIYKAQTVKTAAKGVPGQARRAVLDGQCLLFSNPAT